MRRGSVVVVLLALFLVPFSVSFQVDEGGTALLQKSVPAADLVLLAAAAGLLFRMLWIRRAPLDRPHSLAATGVFVLACALTFLANGISAGPVLELVQCFDYFVLFYLLAREAMDAPRSYVPLFVGTLASFLVLVAAAWYQIGLGTPDYLVRGLFRDRQSYAAACVMLAPLVWVPLAAARPRWAPWAGHVVVALALATLDSAFIVAIVLVQLVVAGHLLGTRWFARSAPAVGLGVVAVALSSSFALPTVTVEHSSRRAEVMQSKYGGAGPSPGLFMPAQPDVDVAIGGRTYGLASTLFDWSYAYPVVSAQTASEARVVPEYLAESWSALRLVADAPIFGYGLGAWQREIGKRYDQLERTGTTFPNSSNGYLMIAVCTGVLGLGAWFFVACRSLARSRRLAVAAGAGGLGRTLGAASFASLAGGLVVMLVCPLTIQPLAVYWVLALAIGNECTSESFEA